MVVLYRWDVIVLLYGMAMLGSGAGLLLSGNGTSAVLAAVTTVISTVLILTTLIEYGVVGVRL